ncbi:glycoside hydrolase family 3 protein [Gynuella sunshinyii]|uniref:beta-glucosidase n=1 Tax=Gynuella sunshinyii YC6258 TaxID=1445510 RepID=A0A0C5V8A0_9GAMM|nr:glycoside hydrolase family 3 N-terminal domain-containing protein [Gynuella sunshinyii]AJQ95620.1 beta-glucosidase-related glycosidase [Gynuella sunshinyii YC6258]
MTTIRNTILHGSYVLLIALPLSSFANADVELESKSTNILNIDGKIFKDLNKNGKLDPYEDWRLSPEERSENLLSLMTLEEKAGLMMHGSAPGSDELGRGSSYDQDKVRELIEKKHISFFITRLKGDEPGHLAEQNNILQNIAESTRLGIPITISSDPRNSFQYLEGASIASGKFSKWPETLGMAAINDETLTEQYADIIRQEYRAVGITEALSPQADIASEPRWPRISGTFGEDPGLVGKMTKSYIIGMQAGSNGINKDSVVTVLKHWVGYGAAKDGWDSHNSYGKFADFESASLETHISPFVEAFKANVAGVMPTYSILQGATYNGKSIPQVGGGYNRFLLQDLLRDTYGFDGVILSDWLITRDCEEDCINGFKKGEQVLPRGMPWGVEELSVEDRFVKAIEAGVDQFGGVTDSEILVNAVKNNKISESRIDSSVVRILNQKFKVGLFENSYVDAKKADEVVGNEKFSMLASAAQFNSLILLKNDNALPIKKGLKVWLHGINRTSANEAGFQVVERLQDADIALIRTSTPYERPHENYFFGKRHNEGALNFKENNEDYLAIKEAKKYVPTVVTVYLDRPAILTNVLKESDALIANFGVSDEVLFSRLTSNEVYVATLPFELPSSMKSVLSQDPAKPYDSNNPLFPIGFGLDK